MKNITKLIFLLVIFVLGILTHKHQIYPYVLLKDFVNNTFFLKKTKQEANYNLYANEIKKAYPNWNDKNNNLIIIKNKKYFQGINIFSNRNYFNHLNDVKLTNFDLIQLPRHYKKKIKLIIKGKINIYRPICEINDNSIYDDWEAVDFQIKIIGASCIHERLVKIEVNNDLISLDSGGPISSDPIFIYKINQENSSFEIIN